MKEIAFSVSSLVMSVVVLVIGIGIGFGIAPRRAIPPQPPMMHHIMPMADMMGSMMQGLEGKAGDDFDKAFLSEMIVHHEGAVAMAQRVLDVSTRPELRNLAQEIVEAQQREIGQMKQWQVDWFRK